MSRRSVAITVLVVACVAVVGLRLVGAYRQGADPGPLVGAGTTGPSRQPVICRQVTPTDLPADLQRSDRRLVPFSRGVSGIETEWTSAAGSTTAPPRSPPVEAESDRSLMVIDGGYIDDILEAYDDLVLQPPLPVDGQVAEVLATRFLQDDIRVAYWRDPEARAPCNVHAVVTANLTRAEFERSLASAR